MVASRQSFLPSRCRASRLEKKAHETGKPSLGIIWSNDDDDNHPNSTPAPVQRDWESTRIDGPDDLADFFPVFLDIKQLLTVLPPSSPETPAGEKVVYKLKQADGALNFIYTSLTRATAFDYKTHDYSSTGYGIGGSLSIFDDAPIQITAAGVELHGYFLHRVKNENQGVILIEGREPSARPLVLTVEKGGLVIAELSLHLMPVGFELQRGGIGNNIDSNPTAPTWRSQGGAIRDLVSVWDTHASTTRPSDLRGDWIQARINLGGFDVTKLPANYIVWSIDEHPAPSPNTLETPQLRWPGSFGVKTIRVTVGGREFTAQVDVPNVGTTSHLDWGAAMIVRYGAVGGAIGAALAKDGRV